MSDFALTHLPRGVTHLGRIAARPRAVAAGCIVAFTALGFAALALAETSGTLAAICRPLATSPGVPLVFGLWCAMTLAMMLPTAAPMILTYAEIAEAAARKGETIVSPFVLAAGYAAVWICFAVAASTVQIALSGSAAVPAETLFSAALFIGAGIYQFTALKHACLHRCRQPFQFFFTNWSTTPRGVFRLGLRQGAYCAGCCWAMMALMLAAGAMNVLWMAALGIVMTFEKMTHGAHVSRAIGIALIAIGCGFVWFG